MEGEKRKNTQEYKEEISQTNPNNTSTRVAYKRSTSIQAQFKESSTRVKFFPLLGDEVLMLIFSKRRP